MARYQASPSWRTYWVIAAVVFFHVVALLAFQSGLLHRVSERVLPVLLVSEATLEKPRIPISPPLPQPLQKPNLSRADPNPSPPPPFKPPVFEPSPPVEAPKASAVAQPVEKNSATAVQAELASSSSAQGMTSQGKSTSSAVDVISSTINGGKNELPSAINPEVTDRDYPRWSSLNREEGLVVVRVWINEKGLPEKSEIKSPSSYPRLNDAALKIALRWKYKPGLKSGSPESMWLELPIRFVLRN